MYESIFPQQTNAKNYFFSSGPVCEICGKIFTLMKNLIRHQHSIHQNSDTFSCAECNYATPRKSDLNRHIMKRHATAPTGLNPPPKVARRESSIINPPPNDRLLDQNTQRGFGLSPKDIPDEVHRFFQEEQPWGTDKNLRQSLCAKFPSLSRHRNRQPTIKNLPSIPQPLLASH